MQKHHLLICLLPIFAVTLNGCSNTQSFSNGEASGSVSADNHGNAKIQVNGKDGTQVNMAVGNAARYPDLPFPQYPGSSITMSMNQDNQASGQQANKTVTLETADAPNTAVSFYKSWFRSKNWKINMDSTQAGMSTISAEKGEMTASIMCMPGAPSRKTSIQIIVSGR